MRERKKAEKREAKAREKEERRRRLEDERARAASQSDDPDLAGIVPGPQPAEEPGSGEDEGAAD